MSAYKKVAVAGATGNLGPAIVEALINAGFEVTTLSRTGRKDTSSRTGTTGELSQHIRTVQVDYDSEESLVNALKGQDAVVSNLPKHDSQITLIDASIKAGVKRFIPSEFGSNVSGNAKTAALPVFKGGKLVVQDHLNTVSDKISYTIIVNGFFLDWGLAMGMIVNFRDDPTQVYDGGDSKHSFTLLSDIGKAVASTLQHPDQTHNRTVYVQSVAASQNQLIAIGKKIKPDWKPEIQDVTTAQALENSYAALSKGGESIMPAMVGFIKVSALGSSDFGNLWNDKNDNDLLGIKQLSEEELEKVVAQFI